MNICLLFSVCAPIGFDRSRKVSGLDRSKVWTGGKTIRSRSRSKLLTRICSAIREVALHAGAVPLTGSQPAPRGRQDTASGRCTSSRPACSGASSTQSYWFPLSDGRTRETEGNLNTEVGLKNNNVKLISWDESSLRCRKSQWITCHFPSAAFSATVVFLQNNEKKREKKAVMKNSFNQHQRHKVFHGDSVAWLPVLESHRSAEWSWVTDTLQLFERGSHGTEVRSMKN